MSRWRCRWIQVDEAAQHPALAGVWARRQIAALADQQFIVADPGGELADQIKQLALDYGLPLRLHRR